MVRGLLVTAAFLIGMAVLCYGLVATAVWASQSSLLFHIAPGPPPDSAAAGCPEFMPRQMETAAGKISFWAAAPRPCMPVIVHFHGNAGTGLDEARLFRRYAQQGWGVVLTEYSGWTGNPGGPVSEKTMRADALAYADWIAREWPHHAIISWGESLGTGVAAGLAASRPVMAVVLDSPYTSIRELAETDYPWLPVRLLLENPFDTMALLPGIAAPVLVAHGGLDAVIPVEMGQRVHAALRNPGPGVFLPSIAHTALLADSSHAGEAAVYAWLDGVRIADDALAVTGSAAQTSSGR